MASVDYEAVVAGAGFAGVRMIWELQKRGISGKVFEAGSGVGGTWYWNRYPGARTDTESWVYIVTFLEELGMKWDWKERYPTQPEVEAYLNSVVDYLDLRKNIQFNTKVTKAHYDEEKNIWNIETANGEQCTCTYFISATGVLAVPLKPPFPGLESFKGEVYQSGLWPKDKVDFAGKRVAVVGTGATGVQIIPTIAHTAKSVTVFQRTPNYVLPGRNHPLTDDQRSELQREHMNIINRARNEGFGQDMVDSKRTLADAKDEAEIERILDHGWEIGGFHYIFETFGDMLTNQKTNDVMAEYIRKRIRSVVQDKDTAEMLSPHYPILSKRPPIGHRYYEAFNRDTVKLVDAKKNPITEITPNGLRNATDDYDVDIIIFAIGFDALTGTLTQMDLKGSNGQQLGAQLKDRLSTAYGITVEGFPNFFMISGPQSPFANIPVVIDNTSDWIGKTISHMRENGYTKMDTSKEVADDWTDMVTKVWNSTVLPAGAKAANSWTVGANVTGKRVEPLMWFGGCPPYFAICDKVIDDGYPGFQFSSPSGITA